MKHRSLTLSLLVAAAVLHSLPLGAAEPDEKPLPRVLILGDSISIGYTPHVQELLEGEAVVVRPTRPNDRPENCAGTTYGVTELDRWLALDGGDWDVIHFNWGLHDIKRVDPDSGEASTDAAHPRQAEPQAYEKNLRDIVARLDQTDARLIFATTTPVPEGVSGPHRDVADAPRYNEIARRAIQGQAVAVNDLYAFALPRLKEIQRPMNVHFTDEGSKQLAEQVAKAIRAELSRLPQK